MKLYNIFILKKPWKFQIDSSYQLTYVILWDEILEALVQNCLF